MASPEARREAIFSTIQNLVSHPNDLEGVDLDSAEVQVQVLQAILAAKSSPSTADTIGGLTPTAASALELGIAAPLERSSSKEFSQEQIDYDITPKVIETISAQAYEAPPTTPAPENITISPRSLPNEPFLYSTEELSMPKEEAKQPEALPIPSSKLEPSVSDNCISPAQTVPTASLDASPPVENHMDQAGAPSKGISKSFCPQEDTNITICLRKADVSITGSSITVAAITICQNLHAIKALLDAKVSGTLDDADNNVVHIPNEPQDSNTDFPNITIFFAEMVKSSFAETLPCYAVVRERCFWRITTNWIRFACGEHRRFRPDCPARILMVVARMAYFFKTTSQILDKFHAINKRLRLPAIDSVIQPSSNAAAVEATVLRSRVSNNGILSQSLEDHVEHISSSENTLPESSEVQHKATTSTHNQESGSKLRDTTTIYAGNPSVGSKETSSSSSNQISSSKPVKYIPRAGKRLVLFAFAPKPTGPSPGTLRVLETAIPKNAWFLQELLNEKASGTLDESNGTIVRLPSLDEPNNKMVEIYFDVLMSSQFAKSKWEWEKLMTSAEKYGQDNMMDRLWDIFVAWMEFVTRGVIQWLPWQTSSDNNDVRDMALFLNCHRKILDRFTNSYVPKWMAGGREVESAVGDQSGNKRKRSRVSKEDGQRKRQKMTKANNEYAWNNVCLWSSYFPNGGLRRRQALYKAGKGQEQMSMKPFILPAEIFRKVGFFRRILAMSADKEIPIDAGVYLPGISRHRYDCNTITIFLGGVVGPKGYTEESRYIIDYKLWARIRRFLLYIAEGEMDEVDPDEHAETAIYLERLEAPKELLQSYKEEYQALNPPEPAPDNMEENPPAIEIEKPFDPTQITLFFGYAEDGQLDVEGEVEPHLKKLLCPTKHVRRVYPAELIYRFDAFKAIIEAASTSNEMLDKVVYVPGISQKPRKDCNTILIFINDLVRHMQTTRPNEDIEKDPEFIWWGVLGFLYPLEGRGGGSTAMYFFEDRYKPIMEVAKYIGAPDEFIESWRWAHEWRSRLPPPPPPPPPRPANASRSPVRYVYKVRTAEEIAEEKLDMFQTA